MVVVVVAAAYLAESYVQGIRVIISSSTLHANPPRPQALHEVTDFPPGQPEKAHRFIPNPAQA